MGIITEKIDKRRKENPRNRVYQFRMNGDEGELLESLSVITDDPKSEVIRKALKLYDQVKRSSGEY